MIQAIIQVLIVGLLTVLVGIIWMIVHDIFEDNPYPDDNRLDGTPMPKSSNGEGPHEHPSPQSKAAA